MTTSTAPREHAADGAAEGTDAELDYDAVVIGAGFAGMYQLHLLRQRGYRVRVYEAGDDVGGTWYWNRYPGARCDVPSIHYSYSFDEDLEQEWDWSERYASQPELLRYARHVADRFDLRRDITFGTRVESLAWDDGDQAWTARLSDGTAVRSRFVVAATGCLSAPQHPAFEGLGDYTGELYYTSSWPDGVDLAGKRVGIVGTGSSGLQTITEIGPVVGSLVVFQRTPSYSIPAVNAPITAEQMADVKSRYPEIREINRASRGCYDAQPTGKPMAGTDPAEVRAELDRRWEAGGTTFTHSFNDIMVNEQSNEVAAQYVRDRIRQIVTDPGTAERLTPRSYPIATKRICIDTGYFEVFNQPNVTLIDINEQPIERFTQRGIVAGGVEHELDVVILATGFDAMTGALNRIDIRAGGRSLKQEWEHGPRTYLGLMSAGFPNLFMITGPGSPSVLSNMIVSIEFHAEQVAGILGRLRTDGRSRIEPTEDAQREWTGVVNGLAAQTLFPRAASWYMGANIPGKERVFMPYVGGCDTYAATFGEVVADDYRGFALT